MMSPEPRHSSPPLKASLLRRLGAMVYDGLLLIAAYMILAGLYVALVNALGLSDVNAPLAEAGSTASSTLLQWTLFPLLILFTLFFYCYFWIKHGRTLGMQSWKIYFHTKPTLQQSLVRLAVAPISLLLFGLGYLAMLWDPDDLTWHDRVSNTRVELRR